MTADEKDLVKLIPTIQYFRKTYAPNSDSSDQKGVGTFKMFEPREKLVRLREELELVKNERVAPNVLDIVIGKHRAQRYEGYGNYQ